MAVAPSAFLDRESPPNDPKVRSVLGRAAPHWVALHAGLSAAFPPLSEKWSYSGKAYGWSLQLRQKKRTVLYMIPCPGHFVASFALGEKACVAARADRLPAAILTAIASAPKYPEGKAVRLEVRSKKDLEAVLRLAAVKMAN